MLVISVQLSSGEIIPLYLKYYFFKDGDSSKTCELSCMDSGYHFYHTFGSVVDGTRCSPDRRDVCINGECVVSCFFITCCTLPIV